MTDTTSTRPCLTLAIDKGVALITMDRPHAMNAFDRTQRELFQSALLSADADADVRVIVITGAGKAFCAGQDQHESAAMDAAGSAARIDSYMALYEVFRGLGKPVIARINGVAAGAGLQIALMSDLRIASTQARFGMTEFKVGSAAIFGSALLHSIIGEAAMKRLVLLAEIVPAAQSLALGLVHEVVDDARLDERVAEICTQVLQWSPTSVAITKSWWKEMGDEMFAKAAAAARRGHAINFASGAYSLGARKFTERKQANRANM
ncbi:enoyl-CoA hydratase/carnithine racemase [Variovorax paradoxus]|uniref:enoyl-CoA hydratase/isomerase family protein n=1 Tax=Variovorax paradoxus TaxID=34073 RepID=UPI002783C43B|nr:enoyl-CoA hydratase/isomerase family protein [Variovorax paradoxus]MDP9928291.1 enoyl-CoA hydratase/carnithine racemase [Variovorax paradoxus]MDQ0024929.1 enoyl-CoA hydratase/carnithine racemase [Variovorax paradoxus]